MATTSGVIKDKSNEFGQKFGQELKDDEKGMSNLLSSAQEKISEIAPNIAAPVRNIAEKAKGVATSAYENVGSMIEENPTRSFVVGLGVGCLIGVTLTTLLRR